MRTSWLIAALLLAVGCGGSEQESNEVSLGTAAEPITQAGIQYHGGPVLTGCKTVYLIWYGNWSGSSGSTVLPNLTQELNGSAYFNIVTTYSNSSGSVSNCLTYGGSATDNYSRGTSLSDAAILGVVTDTLNSGRLPRNTNGVYFVLSSKDVNATSGFCTQYCGWHTYGTIGGTNIKYAFVGDPSKCITSCGVPSFKTPHGQAADSLANQFAHQLVNSVTDPNNNAWYDTGGQEPAGKCSWTFGTVMTNPLDGTQYNVTLGTENWILQQLWVNAGAGYCSTHYP